MKFSMYKGEYVRAVYRVVEPNESGVYVPVDLTGKAIEFQVKPKVGDPDGSMVIQKAVGTGITLLTQSGDTLGKFELILQTGDTSGKTPGLYQYDIWLIDGGERRPLQVPAPFEIKGVVNLP